MDQRAISMQARRDRIVDTAERLIVRESLAAFTMRRLAKEVGLSVKTLYNLCGDKHAIAAEVEDRAYCALEASVRSISDDLKPIDCVLEIMTRAAQQSVLRKGIIHPMWRGADDIRAGELPRSLEFMELGTQLVEAALREAADQNRLSPKLNAHALATQCSVSWFGTAHLWARGVLTDADFVTRVKYAAYSLLLPYAEGDLAETCQTMILALQAEMEPLSYVSVASASLSVSAE
ncbi:MAG: TetR/AcrR family transcriptional regulator [Pseudomonadota bacterium]